MRTFQCQFDAMVFGRRKRSCVQRSGRLLEQRAVESVRLGKPNIGEQIACRADGCGSVVDSQAVLDQAVQGSEPGCSDRRSAWGDSVDWCSRSVPPAAQGSDHR
jgi:hypothetical protein